MKQLSNSECKEKLLEMMISIDKCCRDNNIEYTLDYGSLLGAVRHKGFIPWDDDIDLSMTRKNFDKFLKVFNSDKYELLTRNDKDWGWHFIRICDRSTKLVFKEEYEKVREHGLWIAVFPVDKIPDDKKKWNTMKTGINFYEGLCRLKRSKWLPNSSILRNMSKTFLRICLMPFPITLFSQIEHNLLTSFQFKETNQSFLKGTVYHEFPSFWFDSYINLEFEGHKFMAISHYDEYLKYEYGDYMTYPPIEEQVPKHEYNAYLLNNDHD